MQIITKGTNNTLVFTLTEKQTLTAPYYLFCFKHQVEMTDICFISADLSDYPERYNEFLITETSGTQTLTSGVVTLAETGTYEYEIYEQTSSTNLNKVNATSLLEIGLIKVVGTAGTVTAYDSQPKNIITYGS